MTASTEAAPISRAEPSSPARLGVLSVAAWVGAGAMAVSLGFSLLVAGGQQSWLVLSAAGVATVAFAGIAIACRSAAASYRMQARLLACFDSSREGQLVADFDGRVSFINSTALKLLKFDRITDLQEIEKALVGDADAVDRFRRLRVAVAQGSAFTVEIRLNRDGSHPAWWLISASPLVGWPRHAQWSFEDITARREIELVLREEQLKLVDFMDHAPVGFYSVDSDGRFLFANATLAEWLGIDARELTQGGHCLHDFLLPAPEGAPPYALTDRGDDLPSVNVLMRAGEGQVLQASIAQMVVRGDAGEPLWTRSVVRDLTPERQIREALRASEDRFERFFKDAPIGVALLTQAGRLSEWNRAFQDLIGAPQETLADLPITDLLTDRDRDRVATDLAAVIDGEVAEGPIEVTMRGQGDLVVSLYAKRLDGAMDEPPSLLLQVIDRTTQKNLEIQFSQSQKMQAVGQLAGGIAHDFNNLLTAMIGFCDLLLLRHKPGDPSFADIMQIKQNANRAANLVRQLLAFSRQQTLQPRVLNVTDALSELSNLLRRLIGENIEMKMTHGRNLGLVRVDQGQLEQVIINLAVNARDAMPNGGSVAVTTENVTIGAPLRRGSEEVPRGDYVAVTVADTGIGIPPENIDRIFDPFFSTKEVGSGTGLGLSTVYGIVRQTGGYIFVDSEPGRGAKFMIYLPRYEKTEEDAAAAPPEAVSARDLTGAGRILLVEDEDAVRTFSSRALRNKGYEVLEADSGESALELMTADSGTIDLLITDVIMPNMDGPTLIGHVREEHPDMKVICISGYAEDRFRGRLDEGSETVHFLAKPFSLKQLAAKVKDVLRATPD